jgi:putative transposase
MDNHFHAMFMLRERFTLAEVVGNLKRHCARQINLLRGREETFWQEGYHDHAIRDEEDFWNHLDYLHYNPVKRGWVQKPEEYPWSTAHPTRQSDIDWHALGYS